VSSPVRNGLLVGGLIVVGVAGWRVLFRPQAVRVEAVVAASGPVEDLVANSEGGTVRSHAEVRLGVERAGRVAAIERREGATAHRGEVVLRLDSSTAERELESVRRQLEALDAAHEAAHAADRLAKQELARTEPLLERGAATAAQLDQARSQADAASAELKAAEARLAGAHTSIRLAENELAHHRVLAPFDGVVSRRLVEVGESVVPGQAVLELVCLDRLYVSAPIDERDAGRLVLGLPARVTLDSYPGVEWPGVITRISPIVETAKEENRTLEIEIDLKPDPARPPPRPGMTADVEVVLARRNAAVRIPTLAVAEGHRVLVAERGRAAYRSIEVGLHNWQWTEVTSGLAIGERVITTLDRPGLKAGVGVRVSTTPGPGGAASDSVAAAAAP
jgi:HlyD family secretion protein